MNRASNLGDRHRCELCNHREFALFAEIPRVKRKIVKCDNCGLVFVNPWDESFLTFDFEDRQRRERKYETMRRIAEDDGRHNEDIVNREEIIRTLHFRSRKERIEHYVRRGRLLDIGCGRGFFLRNFVGGSIDYFGVEPRQRISQEAKRRVGQDKIFCGTLKEAGFPDSHFDSITMINLIEHLPSPREALEEGNRIMKGNGILLIETPNVDSLFAAILGTRWHALLESEHHYFFSEDTLTAMLNDTGFAVQSVTRGDKLFSLGYLLYRLSWYNKKMPASLERILQPLNLIEKTIRLPQLDELIVIAKKVTDPEKERRKDE